MALALKAIKNRIRSIENTRKVTSAMEMVSVAKLNRVNKLRYAMKPYFTKLDFLLKEVINSRGGCRHPFLEGEKRAGRICLCLVTSDSGLCGNYNHHLIRFAQNFIAEKGRENIDLICVGKQGLSHFKKHNCRIVDAYLEMNGRYSGQVIDRMENALADIFISGRAREVYIAYMRCQSALIHDPAIVKFLGLERQLSLEQTDYLFEPDINSILSRLIPEYLSLKLKLIILEAFTAEHSARAVAMQSATNNAKELLRGLTVIRNNLRQASITQDLIQIVSSSAALKG